MLLNEYRYSLDAASADVLVEQMEDSSSALARASVGVRAPRTKANAHAAPLLQHARRKRAQSADQIAVLKGTTQ